MNQSLLQTLTDLDAGATLFQEGVKEFGFVETADGRRYKVPPGTLNYLKTESYIVYDLEGDVWKITPQGRGALITMRGAG